MAIPGIPQNAFLQQANGQVLVTWDASAGATSYTVNRSTDNITYSFLATVSVPTYLDTSVTVNTLYYYQVAATNADGTSIYSNAGNIVPSRSGFLSLQQIRLLAQQRADRENSNFVTKAEWTRYINQSYFELYDLITNTYQDYYLTTASITTDGVNDRFALPNDFYKVMGVDLALNSNANSWVTLRKFDFISRNRFIYPSMGSNYLGVFNLQYRVVGNEIFFIPIPQGGQTIRLWYIPRMVELLQETDVADGVSGWDEYIVVDAAIKALQKEESDVTALMAQKQALVKRIEESATNRDAGAPDTISNTRTISQRFNGSGGPGYDGSWGGN